MVGIIGAGKTGRGFLARLLREANVPFILFDRSSELIDSIEGGFEIEFFSNVTPSVQIKAPAMCTLDPDAAAKLLECGTILVSVGGGNLEQVGQWLASVFGSDTHISGYVNIILCENAINPAKKLKAAFMSALPDDLRQYADACFGFSDAAVFCTTIERTPGSPHIASENYPRLILDAKGIKGALPDVPGFELSEQFENVLMRKIYTYNSASGVIAYLGWWKGYEVYSQAANDPEILSLLDRHYEEVNRAICREYGYSTDDQAAFAALSKAKFCDKAIVDSIERNAREPQRKLSSSERLVGPALLIEKHSGDTSVLALSAAAALLYEDLGDTQWTNMKKDSLDTLFSNISGLSPDSTFALRVIKMAEQLKKTGRGKLPTEVLLND